MRPSTITRLLVAALAVGPVAVAGASDWPAFRGPAGTGTSDEKALPATWSPKSNVAWVADVPGYGWSSPIVKGDKVFVTSFVTPKGVAAPKLGFYLAPGKVPEGECRWVVRCLDRTTGKTLWEQTAHKGAPALPIHPKNSYAAETPSADAERVYVYFGNVGLFCYDHAGTELWSRPVKATKTRSDWGPGASPVLYRDRVFLANDNDEASYLLALDAKTGKELWNVKRAVKTSWANPFVWENDKRVEVVTSATEGVKSYDLDGKLLWELGPMSEICIPTPVAAHGMLFVSSGYEFGNKTRPIYAVKPGATGNISPKAKDKGNEFVAWVRPSDGSYTPSPVVYGDYLYVLYSQGFLACFEAKTGKPVYERQRLGGSFSASPWAYDGKVFCLSEDGTTTVVKAGPEFEVLGTNRMGEVSLATPALSGRGLLLRTQTKLYCLQSP